MYGKLYPIAENPLLPVLFFFMPRYTYEHPPRENLVDFRVRMTDLHEQQGSRQHHFSRGEQPEEAHEVVVLVFRDGVVDLDDELLNGFAIFLDEIHELQK